MKKFLLTLVAACGLAMVGQVQGASCNSDAILTVDMSKVYGAYGKAEKSKEQFQKAVDKAQQEMRVMLDEGIKMARELQEIQEKMDNPALSEAARNKFRQQAEEQAEAVRKKEGEVNQFRQETDRQLMQRREEFVTQHVQEIRGVIEKIAEKRESCVALNTSGIEVLYSAKNIDISDEVIAELNRVR